MSDRDPYVERELESKLRELGSRIEYPPTPDLARAVQERIEEEQPTRRGWFLLTVLPARWAVAAVLALVLAVPVLSPAARDLFSGGFAGGGGQEAGGGGSGSSESAGETPVPSPDAARPSSADGDTGPGESETGGFMASGPVFSSLDQMVATSDLIVVGTVEDVKVGEVIRDETLESEDYPTRDLNTVVSVDEVLKGSASEGAVTVKTLELAYTRPNLEWRQPGERVLLFLSRGRETPDLYIMAGISYSQTAYVLRDDDIVAAVSDPAMPVIDRITSLLLPELRREVEEAKARISRGEVKPLKPER